MLPEDEIGFSPEREAMEDEAGAFGDPRRCPIHNITTSSSDGMFDAPCGACEYEGNCISEKTEWEEMVAATGMTIEEYCAANPLPLPPKAPSMAELFGDDDIPF